MNSLAYEPWNRGVPIPLEKCCVSRRLDVGNELVGITLCALCVGQSPYEYTGTFRVAWVHADAKPMAQTVKLC